ncbi:hypothetical protein [Halolactibacillus alkaliphilus]|uniref:hypothetical protein n=1 Tax=Halolactibacillus alkaliphilus TaxID=442899 RepID=UPI0011602AC6|nr:hypothetical protein [Halolactibacillus alkaliphilus]
MQRNKKQGDENTLRFADLKEKGKLDLENMLLERQDYLLFGIKLIQQRTPKSLLVKEMWKIEQEISIIERKLKRR